MVRRPRTEKHSVALYFVQAAIARLGPAARVRVLAAAGIAPATLTGPEARVPAAAFSALWLAVARELDDEFFGLDRRRMKVGSFALLCQAVLGCENLERALKRILRGMAVFLDDIGARLQVQGDEAVVVIANRIAAPAERRFADETFLVLVHGLVCWLAGRRIALRGVDFAHPRPVHAGEYTLMFADALRFDAPATCLRLDAAALDAPIVQDAAALRRFLRTAPQSVFLKYRNEDSWRARVRQRLRALTAPAEWPAFDRLAAQLGTTPTTLRRRLAAEGASYQALKDQLRNDMALEALAHTGLSVDEIGAGLGYQDASAFHRAFKRWNGLQPGEWRRRQQEAAAWEPQAAAPRAAHEVCR